MANSEPVLEEPHRSGVSPPFSLDTPHAQRTFPTGHVSRTGTGARPLAVFLLCSV